MTKALGSANPEDVEPGCHSQTASTSIASTRPSSLFTGTFDSLLYPSTNRMSTIALKIEFGGGLELLFGNQRSHRIDIPSRVPSDNDTTVKDLEEKEAKAVDVSYLVHHMRDHMLKERAELFMENGTV